MATLTHFDEHGASRMVDVSAKTSSLRIARAEARIRMQAETRRLIEHDQLTKGNVREVARLAGIMAAKKTADLIPLCHPLGLDGVELVFDWSADDEFRMESRVVTSGRTGVEMEALTAVTVAALTVYDMCKSVDRGMEILQIRLLEKSGGKSGHFLRETTGPSAD